MINVRFISDVALSKGKTVPTESFLARSTAPDLKEAANSLDKWCETMLTQEQWEEIEPLISTLWAAAEQAAHEDGVKLGIRLMHECLA